MFRRQRFLTICKNVAICFGVAPFVSIKTLNTFESVSKTHYLFSKRPTAETLVFPRETVMISNYSLWTLWDLRNKHKEIFLRFLCSSHMFDHVPTCPLVIVHSSLSSSKSACCFCCLFHCIVVNGCWLFFQSQQPGCEDLIQTCTVLTGGIWWSLFLCLGAGSTTQTDEWKGFYVK